MPTSCSDLAIIGSIKPNSGFYTVKASDSQLRTVFCDFTQAIGSAGWFPLIITTNSTQFTKHQVEI